MLWQQSLSQVSTLLTPHLSKVADKILRSQAPQIATSKLLFYKLWDVYRQLLTLVPLLSAVSVRPGQCAN